MKTSFYQYTFEQLSALFERENLVPASARHMYNWHYKKNRRDSCGAHNLTEKAKQFITQNLDFTLPEIDQIHLSEDKTVKFLFRLNDGQKVETVLIPFQRKYTACISSQVGCAMKCSFCFTGTQGLRRHLRTEEIVGQFLQAQAWLSANRPDEARLLNIVFMGQGEPLHNFDAVKTATEIFLAQNGTSIACHKITISTSGYLPGLERWKKEMPNVNLALSLHSPFNEKRNKLIPINRKYPLETIMPLVESVPYDEKRFVTYEYLLIKDYNDLEVDAHATGQLLRGKKAYINLIPFNPYPGSEYERPETSRIDQFKKILDQYKIPTLIRTTKGDQILAACGQLNTKGTI